MSFKVVLNVNVTRATFTLLAKYIRYNLKFQAGFKTNMNFISLS